MYLQHEGKGGWNVSYAPGSLPFVEVTLGCVDNALLLKARSGLVHPR